jgi:hypothetical protein
MKKATTLICAISIIVSLCFGGFPTAAQNSTKDQASIPFTLPPGILKNWDKIPARAKQALTPKAKETWEHLTPKQQQKVRAKIFEIIRNVLAKPGPVATLQKPSFTKSSRSRTTTRAPRPAANIRAVWESGWANEKPTSKTSASKLHHPVATKSSPLLVFPQTGCIRGPEQFIRTFFEASLARPPHADELSYWMNSFAQAQAQGTLITAAQNLGSALFLSQEYANRGRSNRDFVYDCYQAYLKRAPEQGGWDFWTNTADQYGQAAVVPGFAYSTEFNSRVSEICNVATFDGDNDGLPDNFENVVADNFTPFYHVSQGETDNYSTFLDSIPQTVKARFGQTPVSHFRVVPLSGNSGPIRFNNVSGRWESFLRIDYWTMWDHDSGLVGDSCDLAPGEQLLEGLRSHDIDNERSALLVSAPAVWNGSGFSINLDPNAYSSLSLYTAAHENTPTAHNQYINYPENPRPAGNRWELWQSLSKHGTYSFNPDGVVLLQQWQIEIIFDIVYQLFEGVSCDNELDSFWIEMFGDPAFGWSCDTWFWISVAVVYYVNILVFVCATESFHEQGSQLANIRINLGEPANPINGSSFIQEDTDHTGHLFSKLVQPLQFESLF